MNDYLFAIWFIITLCIGVRIAVRSAMINALEELFKHIVLVKKGEDDDAGRD